MTPDSPGAAPRWQLDAFVFEPQRNRLLGSDGVQERLLEPRLVAVLQMLIEANGATVSDQQLLDRVWAGVVVSDASVYQAVAQLRKALGDISKPHRYIARVSSKGYRLLVPATALAAEQRPLPSAVSTAARPSRGSWIWLAAALLIAAASWWLISSSFKIPSADQAPALPVTTHAAEPLPDRDQDSPGWDHYLQGRWLWSQRRPGELVNAEAQMQDAIKADPKLALAYVGLCDVYHFQHLYGDWPLTRALARCEPLLRDALQLQPELPQALASFALLRMSQNDLDAAGIYLQRALERDPGYAMAWMWNGELMRQLGKEELALEYLRKAEALDPLSGIVKRNLAFALAAHGDAVAAQSIYQAAIVLDPDSANRPVDDIEMLPLTVDRARAFLAWATRFPDRVEASLAARVNLALVRLALGDLDGADRDLRLAEALAPEHAFVLLARAILWRARGEPDRALQLLQQRAGLQPDNVAYAQALWIQQVELGQRAQALAHFQRLHPRWQKALTPPLDPVNERLIRNWLWVSEPAERQALAPAVRELLPRMAAPDRLGILWRLLIGDRDIAAEQLRPWLQ
ncbi:MAG: winged helix-turn-helix domain-containing protein [Lysobacterales bacterium]